MAPLIRLTLISLYLALVLPLPLLAPPGLALTLLIALVLGLVVVLALTSEIVRLDAAVISVGYPSWCRWLLRRGWSLRLDQVGGLTPVATSQGGRVFYVRQQGGGQAFLLPQRIARFDDFLTRFGAATGIDTGAVDRLTPAWTYQLLAVLSVLMLIGELVAVPLLLPGLG
ncbi:MAG: hypothetical protein RLZZ336_1388 [Cyanobacteriota bacterium]|jgi:hypothetical protein